MLTTATKRKIDTARDILVGKIPVPTSQVEQITLALVYKFMSDMDKKAKDLGDSSGFFANGYEKYAWGKLMDKALPARDRVLLYREALEKMSLNPHIPQLFRDVFRDASLPFNDPETLKLFLDVIDQFEYDHSEELGNAFEYLLQVMGSQGDAGQFRTPRHIIDFIVDVVEPSKTDKILDPACGTAGFLISAYNHIKKNGLSSEEMTQLSENFVGYDISQDMQRLSLVNLYLHHFPNPHIYEYDTLTSEDRWNDDFDVILANPPFMTPKGGIRPHNRFSVPSKRAEVLFVDYIMEHLTARGKAGVIVPEGIIFQSQGAYTQLRKMMVEENYLWAVVSLPGGIFNPYSGVKTSILLFDREIAKKTNKILFVKVNNDGYELGAQRRESDKNDLPVARELLLKFKQAILSGKELSLDTVLEMGGGTTDKDMMSSYGFDLNANSHIELEQIINKAYDEVSKSSLKETDYNLSGERYSSRNKKISDGSFITASLSDESIFQIESGGTPDTQNPEYWNGDINWATLVDLPQSNLISEISSTSRMITSLGLQKSSAKLLEPETIIVSTRATIGRIAINKVPVATNQGFKNVIIRDKSKFLPKFVAYVLSSKVDEMKRMASGGTFAEISKTNFSKLEIPLLPLSEQKSLIEELDSYQKIVDGAKQVVENFRFNFSVDESWEKISLEKVADILSGYSFDSKDFSQNVGVKTIKITNVGIGKFETGKDEYLPTSYSQKYKNYLVKQGDIVVALTRPVISNGMKIAMVPKSFDQSLLNQRVASIRGKEGLCLTKYLFLLFQLDFFREYVLEHSKSLMQPNLSVNDLKRIDVPLPLLEEQSRIVKIADELIEKISITKDISRIYEEKIAERIDSIFHAI